MKIFNIHPSLWGYHIFSDKTNIARVTFNIWRSGGKVIIQNNPKKTLRIVGKGFPILNRYELQQGNTCVATMMLKILPLPPSQILECDRQVYVWQNSRILHNNQEIGLVKIRYVSPWLWSKIEVELPETLPLTLQLVVLWHLLYGRKGRSE